MLLYTRLNQSANDQIAMSFLPKIQEFLSETVLPHLARGLITIRRDKPADPVKWLADELHKQRIHEREAAVVEPPVRYTSMQV